MKVIRPLFRRNTLLIFLAVLTAGLTGLTMWEKYNRARMVSSFETMYADRLVPASEMFHLSDLLFERRRVIDSFTGKENRSHPGTVLKQINLQMDSILHAYETTYLVPEEERHLPKYKASFEKYVAAENAILRQGDDSQALDKAFAEVHKELRALSDIQLTVGSRLVTDYKSIHGSMSLMDTVQSGLLLLLVVLIIMLIRDYQSGFPKIRQDKIHLN